jgi:AcrR family transcriptional regulator
MVSNKAGSEDARSRILEAALDLFSDRGFHATTTRKIAQKAGVNEVTLFRHFNNKMTLFNEVMNRIKGLGFDSSNFTKFEIDPEDAIRLAVKHTFEIFENNPREIRLVILAFLERVGGFEEEFVVKNSDEAITFIASAFRKLQEQNKITSKEDPEMLAQMLLFQSVEMATQRVIRKNSPLSQYDRASLCKSIVQLFMA